MRKRRADVRELDHNSLEGSVRAALYDSSYTLDRENVPVYLCPDLHKRRLSGEYCLDPSGGPQVLIRRDLNPHECALTMVHEHFHHFQFTRTDFAQDAARYDLDCLGYSATDCLTIDILLESTAHTYEALIDEYPDLYPDFPTELAEANFETYAFELSFDPKDMLPSLKQWLHLRTREDEGTNGADLSRTFSIRAARQVMRTSPFLSARFYNQSWSEQKLRETLTGFLPKAFHDTLRQLDAYNEELCDAGISTRDRSLLRRSAVASVERLEAAFAEEDSSVHVPKKAAAARIQIAVL